MIFFKRMKEVDWSPDQVSVFAAMGVEHNGDENDIVTGEKEKPSHGGTKLILDAEFEKEGNIFFEYDIEKGIGKKRVLRSKEQVFGLKA